MTEHVFVFDGDISGLIAALQEAQTEIDQFTEDTTAAGDELDGMGDSADNAGDSAESAGKQSKTAGADMKAGFTAAAVAAAAAAAAVAGVVKATLEFAEATNQIAKRAKEVGTSAEEYQKMQGVLDLMTRGGIDASFVINTLARNVDEAAQGNEEYAASFRRLNIDLDEFRGLTPTQQLVAFADGLENVDDRAARTAISMELMGRQGKLLGPAFDEGGAAILANAQKIEDAGLISNETAKQSEDLADAALLLGNTFDALKADVLAPLIPKLQETAENIQAIILEAKESGELEVLGEALNDLFSDDLLGTIEAIVQALVSMGNVLQKVTGVLSLMSEAGSVFLDVGSDIRDMILLWDADFDRTADKIDNVRKALEKIGLVETKTSVDDFADPKLSAGPAAAAGPIAVGSPALFARIEDDKTDALKKGTSDRKKIEEKAAKESAKLADASADAEEKRKDLITEYHVAARDARLDVALEGLEEQGEAFQDAMDAATAAAEEAAARQQDITRGTMDVISQASATIARLAWAVADQKIAAAREGGDAEKQAAIEAFEAAQAVAIVNASISMALAMIEGLAAGLAIGGPPGIALGIATMAFAATVGGIAIGEISSESPPSFEEGGRVPGLGAVPITAHGGEEIATRAAVGRNPGVIDAMNAGGVMGGGAQVVVMKVSNRTTEAMIYGNLRTGSGALSETVRRLQPHAIGHRLPAGFGERG